MAERGFSIDGKYYAYLSQDGRLRIWDTETNVLKQEFTPDLHLSSPPSCLQWIKVAQSAFQGQLKGMKNETQCVALGTTNGQILIYSIATARVNTVLSESDKIITCLSWHQKYGLFSGSKKGVVFEWDFNAGKVRNRYNTYVDSKSKQNNSISAIKIIPHNQKSPSAYIVTVSQQVRVWRLHAGTATLIKNLGHNASPKSLLSLATLNNRNWLIEGSENERLLSFWDVTIPSEQVPQVNGDSETPKKKKRKKTKSESVSEPDTVLTPAYNFVLEDAPRNVDIMVTDDSGVKLSLAAVTRSGVIHYYEHHLNGASTKPIKPMSTLHITTSEPRPLPLQCCKILQDSLMVGYQVDTALVFERTKIDLSSKTQVLIRGDSGKAKMENKKKNKQTDMINKVQTGLQESATYIEPMGGVTRKRTTPGGKVEVPMEARLANLSLDIKSRSKNAVNQNLTKLLMQGLHSRDKTIILMVLQMDDKDVATNTVASLPPAEVPALLEVLIDMATRKTSQCSAVVTWLQAVVRCHSALLLASSNSKANDHLTTLLAIFTNRRSHLCQLMNLRGRIELTMVQRSQTETTETQDAVLNYNDTSSDEEMEVEGYRSDVSAASGDESWGEGEEKRGGEASDAEEASSDES